MTDSAISRDERVRDAFEKTLNSHGHAFHYAVIERAARLRGEGRSKWLFHAAEFPVEVRGADTRVDLILGRRNGSSFFLLAECKRANPALSDWCFVRAPYTHRARWGDTDPLMLEHAWEDDSGSMWANAKPRYAGRASYHVAVEVKTGKDGDSQGKGRGAIEDAATQIMRGLNGMVGLVSREQQLLGRHRTADFLPVIFTTANLWASESNLGSADIERGEVDLASADFGKADWLLLQYNVSEGLKHGMRPAQRPPDLSQVLQDDYIRSIAVVSAAGIEPFLEWSSNLDFS